MCESTTPSTSKYRTPLRRSLGLSRTYRKGSTPLIANDITQGNLNTSFPQTLEKNEKDSDTPTTSVSSTSINSKSNLSCKRLHGLSLRNYEKNLKKKKLDFSEQENQNPTCNNIECINIESKNLENEKPKTIKQTAIIKTQTKNCLFSDLISFEDFDMSNEEFANEIQEIQFLKQKNILRRLECGLKVKPEILVNVPTYICDSFSENLIPQLACDLRFHSARIQLENHKNLNQSKPTHEERVNELKGIIQVWRRGLRDSLEYLSCLTYPPSNIKDIMKHYNIPLEWI